jgi:hypothetical protein
MSRILLSARRGMALVPATAGVLFAFTLSAASQAIPRISAPVSQSALVTLKGHTLPFATALNDLGKVPDSTPTGRVMMLLKHSPEQKAALDKLVQAQQSSASPSFHKWLTTSAYARQFGVADADIQTVTGYLSDQGFTVDQVFPNKMAIEFSGTAGQLRSAFKTEIHSFRVNGQQFFANDRDPQIPAALAPVVRGFSSLNNYQPKSNAPAPVKMTLGGKRPKAHPLYADQTNQTQSVAPGDIAEIYDIPSTANGTGVNIGVVNTSNVNLAYVANYPTTFGLKVKYPSVIVDGEDPGENSNEIDGIEQLELLSAVAPDATLYYYTSASNDASTGINFSIIRAIDDDNVQVLLYDQENCEANLGALGTAFVDEVVEQAAAEGITAIAGAGNGGSDSCQSSTGYGNSGFADQATTGLSVNGWATTPFVTAVGATDFYYGTNATLTQAAPYWNQNNGDISYTSALGYIPEQPWNLSYDGPADSETNIYSADGIAVATGGGISTLGDSNGDTTAAGPYPAPSWQLPVLAKSSDPAVSGSTARVIPDVSVFGGSGSNDSSYMFCVQADECVNGSAGSLVYETAGGTNVASATFAGIAALVVQAHGAQGNINPTLYSMFQSTPSVFHAMKAGTNTVDCASGSPNCGGSGNLTDGSGGLAYVATTSGYNAATGLGSVDVKSLIADWAAPFTQPTTTTFTLTSPGTSTPLTTFVHGTTVQANIGVTSGAGTPTGDVAIIANTPLPNSRVPVSYTLSDGTVTDTTLLDGISGGTYQLKARYGGAGAFEPSLSTPFTVTISPETSKIDFLSQSFTSGATITYGTSISIGVYVFSATNPNSIGSPTGAVTVLDNGQQLTIVPIDATGLATFTAQLGVGAHSLTFSYPGDASYQASSTSTGVPLTVASQQTSTLLTTTSSNDPNGSYAELVAIVSSSAGATTGIGPTGTVAFNLLGTNPKTITSVALVPGTNSTGNLAGIAFYRLPGSYLTGNKDTSVQAVYTPAAASSYATSTSSAVPFTTTKTGATISTTTLATLDGAASYFDYVGSVSFTLSVASKSGTGKTPTGNVSVFSNGSLLGTVALVSGKGTLTIYQNPNTSYLPAPFSLGEDVVTAQYSGDSTYGESTAKLAITILDEGSLPDFSLQSNVAYGTLTSTSSSAPFTLELTSINNYAALGRAITLSATYSTNGLSCSFGSSPVSFSTTSNYLSDTVTCTETKALAAGTYQVLIRAAGNFAANVQTNTEAKQDHTIPLQIYIP